MHQHQRPLAASQYADLDLHQQQQQPPPPPPASHCPEGMHPRGPGSLALPPADTGKHPPLQQSTRGHPPPQATSCCVGGTQPPPPRSPLLMCHTHRQEPLELFCESCDLLCCSSCHLSGHKNHRLVHIGKALQDQQWLFERLAAQLDERRASVENTAKQVEDRLHGVKIMQRKAENQIKMAKMIMMNELNKRASLLIEQLEKISEDFQQRLDDQLQGAIEICGQLDHVHKFVTWATTQHCRSPVLFSKELMQQLLEPSLYLDSWLPVKIKFNWDASYWTKIVASLGQLSVEGGNCPFPEALSLSCPSILRPVQPVPCLSLPSACQRGREQGCGGGGYQACCQPQLCCLHAAPPPPPDLSAGMHKSQLDPAAYGSGCGVASVLPTAAGLHQGQPLLSCWDPQSNTPGMQAASLQCPLPPPPPPPPPPPLPPHASVSSPSPGPGAVHLSGSHDNNLTSHPQHGTLQPPSKPLPVEHVPEKHRELQSGLDAGKTSTPGRPPPQQQQQQLPGPGTTTEGDGMAEDSWEGRQRGEEHGHRHTVVVAGVRGDQSGGGRAQWEERVEQANGVQVEHHSQGLTQAERREEQQGTRPPLPPPPPPPPPPPLLGDYRDARSPPSPETPLTAQESGAEPSRRCSASACGRRRSSRCSQSIPAEPPPPAAPAPAAASPASSSASAGAGGGAIAASPQGGAQDQYGRVEARRRRASDGVIQCVAGQRNPGSGGRPRCRGQNSLHLPVAPVLYYKTEPDNPFSKDETEYEVEEKCYKARNGKNQNSERDVRKAADSPKVPVVCLERLKVLVSRLPPHGRRQSDPLPASGGACSQKTAWAEGQAEGNPTGGAFKRATLLFNTPPYTASRSPGRPPAEPGDLYSHRGNTQPKHVPSQLFSAAADLDLDSDSEPELLSEAEPEYDPQLDSDMSPEYEPHLGSSSSSSEADPEFAVRTESAGGEEETDPGGEWDVPGRGPSEPLGGDYGLPGPARSYGAHGGLGDAEDLDATEDVDSEVEDFDHHHPHQQQQQHHPDLDPSFQADDSDSDIISTHPRDSQFSGESDPELDLSEPDVNNNDEDDDDEDNDDDEPQALRSDLDDGSPTGGHRGHLLMANPALQRGGGAVVGVGVDGAEMESEDFCAVCLIGGELLCCDRCPKVFHLVCHIPPLLSFPTAPFHEPVSPLARHYYQIIKRPMDLSQIRTRLSKSNAGHYSSPEEFVADVYLMFRNCAKFNYPDSEVAQAGRSLESFFNSRLNEAFPLGVFLPAGDMSDSDDEYDEACRAAENGFPWPERREQCHRKRKRRHSLNSRKHHS
ncbi:hypothetical protein CRUP_032021 [Coryphaenoides rupestris]|nr:hypothetical protein CRUP_032021 [Coryphaenoides rupestris]